MALPSLSLLLLVEEQGIHLGVFSDYPVMDKRKSPGVADKMSVTLCATDPEIDAFKPSPKGFLHACTLRGLRPDDLCFGTARVQGLLPTKIVLNNKPLGVLAHKKICTTRSGKERAAMPVREWLRHATSASDDHAPGKARRALQHGFDVRSCPAQEPPIDPKSPAETRRQGERAARCAVYRPHLACSAPHHYGWASCCTDHCHQAMSRPHHQFLGL